MLAKDNLGAESSSSVTAQVQVIDTTAPVVTVNLLSTNDNTPGLAGTVDDNVATINVTVNGSSYAATNNGDGTWTLADNAITPALIDGVWEVAVTATDGVGNVGSDVTASELTVDTVVATLAISLTNDTGSSNSDLVTSDGTLTLANIEAAAAVEYSVDGGADLERQLQCRRRREHSRGSSNGRRG